MLRLLIAEKKSNALLCIIIFIMFQVFKTWHDCMIKQQTIPYTYMYLDTVFPLCCTDSMNIVDAVWEAPNYIQCRRT